MCDRVVARLLRTEHARFQGSSIPLGLAFQIHRCRRSTTYTPI